MMGMKTEHLPNRTICVFEGTVLEAEPAATKARAAHTPPIDIIGGRRLTLYSDGTPDVLDDGHENRGPSQSDTPCFRGCRKTQSLRGFSPRSPRRGLKPVKFISFRHGSNRALIWSDLVKPPPGLTGFESGRLASARGQLAFCLLAQASCRVPAGAARREIDPAGTARSGQGRAAVWRGEANP
jgi:hypothetical protein